MKSKGGFAVSAAWAPRDQTPSSLAARFIDMIARLETIHPMFTSWRVNHKPFGVQPLILDLDAVTKLIVAGVGTDDDGNPEPLYGYSVEATNGL